MTSLSLTGTKVSFPLALAKWLALGFYYTRPSSLDEFFMCHSHFPKLPLVQIKNETAFVQIDANKSGPES